MSPLGFEGDESGLPLPPGELSPGLLLDGLVLSPGDLDVSAEDGRVDGLSADDGLVVPSVDDGLVVPSADDGLVVPSPPRGLVGAPP